MVWLWQPYLIASLLLVWGFIAFIWARGGGSSGSYEFMRLAIHTVPGLLALGFKWIVEHRGFRRMFPELGLLPGRLRFWPLALAIPVLAVIAGHGIPLLVGLVRFDPSLSRLVEELSVAGQDVPADIWGFFWARLGMSASVGLLIFLPIAILTEIGFRAYPLELLSERFGSRTTVLMVAGFWAVALVPFLFLRNPYGSWLGIPVYLAFALGWGSLMAWLYSTARTILAPALALILLDLLDGSLSYILPGNPLLSGAEGLAGAILVLGLGIVALMITREIYIPPKRENRKPVEP